jgi:hypothetical protein
MYGNSGNKVLFKLLEEFFLFSRIPSGTMADVAMIQGQLTGVTMIQTTHRRELAPRSRGLPEKLTRPQLLRKFPAVYGTRRFITALTTAHYLSLS